MKTAAELWVDTIKKQPIDDLTIKHTCESLEELINKKTTGVRLAGLLSRAEAIILRQRKEIAARTACRDCGWRISAATPGCWRRRSPPPTGCWQRTRR